MGLRERKKEQTRRLLAETAWRLFADRGFDQVTVAEVARHAQVAVATVFNYFPTKEDLFYDRLEAFGARLAADVRGLGQRAFALLEHGLGDYATKPPRPPHAPTPARGPSTTQAEGAR